MSVTIPPSMTAAPTSPDRADRATFTARSIALDDWRKNYNVPQSTAIAANMYSNAVDAYNNAMIAQDCANAAVLLQAAAALNAAAAASSAGAALWANTGATYAIGDLRRSPANARIYRRLTASNAGTTDPSVDTTNWAIYSVDPLWVVKTANYTAIAGEAVLCNTTAGTFSVTLPAAAAANDTVRVADYIGTFGANKLTVLRNASKINGFAEDLEITANWASVTLTYIDATVGWRTPL